MPGSQYFDRLASAAGRDAILTSCVAGLVVNERGHILLQQRSDNGEWSVPGGKIEPQERPADAAVREIYEETGLFVRPTQIVGVYGGPEYRMSYPGGIEISITGTLFGCEVVSGALRPDEDETVGVAFIPPRQALTELPLDENFRQQIEQILHPHPRTYFALPPWQPRGNRVRAEGASPYLQKMQRRLDGGFMLVPEVAAVIFDVQDRVLLQQRKNDASWQLPGGSMDPDEAPAYAIVDIIWQEIGLLVEPLCVTGLYGGPEYTIRDAQGNPIELISTTFECRIKQGAPWPGSPRLRYFTLDEMRRDPTISPQTRVRVFHAAEKRPAAYFAPPTWQPQPESDGLLNRLRRGR